MNFQLRISLAALVCFLVVLGFLVKMRTANKPDAQVVNPLSGEAPEETTSQKHALFSPQSDGSVLHNPALSASRQLYEESPERDLEIMAEILDFYREIFREIPPGIENRKITEQLLGGNEKNLIFLSKEHCSLSPNNELLDRWNSPFFFQPLTATAAKIISKGPDQTLWTEDDLVIELKELEKSIQL